MDSNGSRVVIFSPCAAARIEPGLRKLLGACEGGFMDSRVNAGVHANVTTVPMSVWFSVAFLLYWTECQAEEDTTGTEREVKGTT